MKRSEMLKMLTKLLISNNTFSYKDKASDILDFIEEKGMLPPKIENVDCLGNNGYLSLEAAFERGLYQWEKEDETK